MSGGRGGREATTRRAIEEEEEEEARADDAVTDWAVWQLVDPLLPTGGFAHSQGLEAAAHAGLVAGGDERATRRGEDVGWCVETFAVEACRNAASMSIPFVEAARYTFAPLAKTKTRATETGTETGTGTDADAAARSVSDADYADAVSAAVATWRSLDDRMGACLAGNHVASRASTATGAALLRAATAAFGDAESGGPGPDGGGVSYSAAEALRGARRASRPGPASASASPASRRPGGHLATSFGAVAGSLGLSSARAARLFAYLTLRDTLSAATRLNLVGPLRAGAALRRCSGRVEALAAEAARGAVFAARDAEALGGCGATAAAKRAAGSSPLVDVVQGGHDALYSRLFSS